MCLETLLRRLVSFSFALVALVIYWLLLKHISHIISVNSSNAQKTFVDAQFQRCTTLCKSNFYGIQLCEQSHTHTLCDFVNVLTFLSTLIVIMICPVFSFIAAESRQTSGHWSRVFPQVFTCHRCPSARKVCDVNKTLQQHGCLCLQMQKIVASWCIFSILNIWLNKFLLRFFSSLKCVF